jgi:hypothetical protein
VSQRFCGVLRVVPVKFAYRFFHVCLTV